MTPQEEMEIVARWKAALFPFPGEPKFSLDRENLCVLRCGPGEYDYIKFKRTIIRISRPEWSYLVVELGDGTKIKLTWETGKFEMTATMHLL